uniref:Uncharacterized protein n=1 Tax=viral metagenome TaxID=1070528 RepID=A0A6M3LE44_9ZZZZ
MGIIVKCKRGAADKEGPSIDNGLISSDAMATAVGKRFLDENYYVIKKRSLRVPHKGPTIIPHTWISVTDGHLGLTAEPLRVTNYRIVITKDSVWAEIVTEQYEEYVI